MANYKLSHEAKADLKRIYQYGVREFGVTQTDKYFDTLFIRFSEIAENPTQYPAEVMNIIGRQDIEEYLKSH
jgi:toxin ParE1/3/4